ncbi:MAG: hypothetical protein K6F00_04340 [Lachnospiraceae bacterium]|nr:hypothetical protein [Lachnospiraceae bacterium]
MSDDFKWQRRTELLGEQMQNKTEAAPNSLQQEAQMEMELFDSVRSYIRANDVNEFMVAEHFGISIGTVRNWIRQGRIEYKDDGTTIFAGGGHCCKCGKRIAFGSMCAKCKKEMDGQVEGRKGYAVAKPDREEGKIRSDIRSRLK